MKCLSRRAVVRYLLAAATASLLLAIAFFGCSGQPPDASTDGGPRNGGPGEGGGEAAACQPASIAGFVPPLYLPARQDPTACSEFGGDGGLVEGYGAACLAASANYVSCANFDAAAYASPDAANAARCLACLATAVPGDASSYGAVLRGSISVVNYPGCVELADPTEAGSACAQALFEAFACADYACRSSCPVVDNDSFFAFSACTKSAAAYGSCQGYFATSLGCLGSEQGDGGTPVDQVCFVGATAADHYRGFARYLCGG